MVTLVLKGLKIALDISVALVIDVDILLKRESGSEGKPLSLFFTA